MSNQKSEPSVMFPQPQCPFCGRRFESLSEALLHIDNHPGQAFAQETAPEAPARLPVQETSDPLPQQVEEAG